MLVEFYGSLYIPDADDSHLDSERLVDSRARIIRKWVVRKDFHVLNRRDAGVREATAQKHLCQTPIRQSIHRPKLKSRAMLSHHFRSLGCAGEINAHINLEVTIGIQLHLSENPRILSMTGDACQKGKTNGFSRC